MLSELHQKWLEKRGIDTEVATRLGVYSAKRGQDGQCHTDENGDILAFPFIHNGVEVGVKYRGPKKIFWQKVGKRKQFFNRDILDDPLLQESTPLIIVEGEMDALAVATAGYPFVVSVPDGAPPARDGDGNLIVVSDHTHDIDISNDTKFNFLISDWDALSKVKRIIIGVDSDECGQRLANELVRRLDKVRCSFVVFPDDCKDFNDVLVKYGADEVLRIINEAKQYPVEGLYKASDFPPVETLQTYSTGWTEVDEYIKPYTGCFMVIGGFPSHGKSTWSIQFASNMAKLHKWNIAVASFEMQLVPYVTNAIMSCYTGNNIKYAAGSTLSKASEFLEKHFTFIAPNRANYNVDHDIEWLLNKMEAAVIREGVRMVLIDPFNEIEHRRNHDESQTEYIGRAIRKLKAFALQYDVLVCVVVHPTKAASHLESKDLSLYNLADSSHWANKADIGIIVGRLGNPEVDTMTGIYIKKVRYQPDAGSLGTVLLDFDKENRLFR